MTDTAPAIHQLRLLQDRLERLNEQHHRAMRAGTLEQVDSLQGKISELMDKRDAIKRYLGWAKP